MNSYLGFCQQLGCPPLPVTSLLACRYVAFLSDRLCFNSVRQYLSILRMLSLEAGLPNPLLEDWHLSTVLKGLKRELGAEVVKKSPVTPELLLRFRSVLSVHSSLDRAVWGACLLMFFCFIRKSNVFPPSAKGFNKAKHLSRCDFSPSAHPLPKGALVALKWSKTLQFRDRVLSCPLPLMRHHPLCPIEALALAFESDPMPNREGPAFWFATNGKWQPLLYGAFLNRFKIMLRQLDMDPRAFAAHSFRRGGGGPRGPSLVVFQQR